MSSYNVRHQWSCSHGQVKLLNLHEQMFCPWVWMWERWDGLMKLCEKSDLIWRRSDEEERRGSVTLSCMCQVSWRGTHLPCGSHQVACMSCVCFCLIRFNSISFLLKWHLPSVWMGVVGCLIGFSSCAMCLHGWCTPLFPSNHAAKVLLVLVINP